MPGLGCRADRQHGVVCKVGLIGCPSVKARMGASAIVEIEIPPDRAAGVRQAVVGAKIDLLVLDRTPQALDEDVVPPRALAVHADLDVVRRQRASERRTRELRALIRIEDLRLAVLGQSLLQRLDAEGGL